MFLVYYEILRCIYNYINWWWEFFVCMLQIVLYFSFVGAPNFFMNKNTIKTIQINTISVSWKIWKLRLALNDFLKKPRFMVQMIYTVNLHHLLLWIWKVFLVIVDNFNLQFFFVRQPLVTDISDKLVAPHLYNSF